VSRDEAFSDGIYRDIDADGAPRCRKGAPLLADKHASVSGYIRPGAVLPPEANKRAGDAVMQKDEYQKQPYSISNNCSSISSGD